MSYTATGRIIEIFDVNQVTEKFKKRDFVIETEDEKYHQLLKFELHQGSTDKIEPFKMGDAVVVHFNLTGRKYEAPLSGTTYFTTLQAWRIEKV